jgi:hypothetical protein
MWDYTYIASDNRKACADLPNPPTGSTSGPIKRKSAHMAGCPQTAVMRGWHESVCIQCLHHIPLTALWHTICHRGLSRTHPKDKASESYLSSTCRASRRMHERPHDKTQMVTVACPPLCVLNPSPLTASRLSYPQDLPAGSPILFPRADIAATFTMLESLLINDQ